MQPLRNAARQFSIGREVTRVAGESLAKLTHLIDGSDSAALMRLCNLRREHWRYASHCTDGVADQQPPDNEHPDVHGSGHEHTAEHADSCAKGYRSATPEAITCEADTGGAQPCSSLVDGDDGTSKGWRRAVESSSEIGLNQARRDNLV